MKFIKIIQIFLQINKSSDIQILCKTDRRLTENELCMSEWI